MIEQRIYTYVEVKCENDTPTSKVDKFAASSKTHEAIKGLLNEIHQWRCLFSLVRVGCMLVAIGYALSHEE